MSAGTGSLVQFSGDAETKRLRLVALLREKALLRGSFVLASGKTSDYYIDVRKVVLDPGGLHLIGDLIFHALQGTGVVAVGGLAVGAVPISTAVCMKSHGTSMPLMGFFVRKEEKDHGTGGRIAGNIPEGSRVAVVEDVATTGVSAMDAVAQVRKVPADPVIVVAVVDRMEGAAARFAEGRVEFRALSTINELLA